MTDYLEQAAQGGADALWEASRERGVPVPTTQEEALFAAERLEEGRQDLALAEALERMERQGESLPLLTVRRSEGEPVLPEKRLRRALGEDALAEWERGGSTRMERTAGGEDHLWAKRVDLAFQRDSRRYDGAFSLY